MIGKPIEWGFTMDATTRALRFGYGLPATGPLAAPVGPDRAADRWPGIQLAEVARHSPEGEAGAVTGATGVVTFSGVVAGPPLFGALAALTGSTRSGFVALAVLSAAAAIAFAIIPRKVLTYIADDESKR